MQQAHDDAQPSGQVADLARRYAALRQAAGLPGADDAALLDAVFTELDAAVELLTATLTAARPDAQGKPGTDAAERRLLRAVFSDAPVPLFVLALDGTVLRVNKAAGDLLGAKPGYATGRMFAAFVTLPGRAAVQTQLTAVARNRKVRRIRCELLGSAGAVASELAIGLASVTGDNDEIVVAVSAADPAAESAQLAEPAQHAEPAARPGVVEALTARMDLVTAVTRLLLENENHSESMTLQRCARLLAGELAAWVIVDMDRKQMLRRQFVIGPDGPQYAATSGAIAAVNPDESSLPAQVHQAGQAVLIAHAEDADVLGPGPGGVPLLMMLGATSVLSVPLAYGADRYGVLTLARQAGQRHFEMADLALVEELGELLARAIRVDHMFRRNTEIAGALQASLLPRRLPEIPGADLAAAYVSATDGLDVGADFYDAYPVPGGWGLSVGDVRGKGEEAAAVTAAARHAIRVLAHSATGPAQVLAGVNEILLSEQLGGSFVTAGIAYLRRDGDLVRVALGSAGHPAPAVIRADGQVELAGGGGLPLGVFSDAEPKICELTMARDDVLVLYTDGVIQARGKDRAFFADRLHDELAMLARMHPDHIVSALRTSLLNFSDLNLIDDFALMVLRVR